MKVNFVHKNNKAKFEDLFQPQGTLAFVLPSKQDILPLHVGEGMAIQIGASFLSKHDKFVKHVGRQLAEVRLSYRPAYLETVTRENNRIVFIFSSTVLFNGQSAQEERNIEFALSIVPDKDAVNILYANFRA